MIGDEVHRAFEDYFEETEAPQVDIGGFVLDIKIRPITEGHLIELVLPPTKSKRHLMPVTMAHAILESRDAAPAWIESVAGAVLAKLESAERAAMLRKGYA